MSDTTDLPALPYDDGTSSGHSGSSTSAERAARRDSDGTTRTLQERTLRALGVAGPDGLTVAEARRTIEAHHGSMSGALTDLNKAGRIVRLAERREKCEVYVLPEWVEGRQVAVDRVDRRLLSADEAGAADSLGASLPDAVMGYVSADVADLELVLAALRRLARR